MKTPYPLYQRFGLENAFAGFPESEKEIIEQFISYCAISAGKEKQREIRRIVVQFRDVVGKNFDEIQLQEMREFLALLNASDRKEYTKNGIKAHVRRFLRWRFRDWSERFSEFADVKLKDGFNEQKINEGTLLKRDQIEAIMKKETDFVRKSFFISLYESGLRPKELRTLRWQHVRLGSDHGLSELHIFATKTSKARTVFVREATFYLQRLFKNRDSVYIFPALGNKNEPLSQSTSLRWIQKMGEAVGLTIFPYLLRHTRAHELYSKMPSKVAQKFMGHSSDMSELYAHISSNDIKDSMLKTVYNFEELPQEKKHSLEIEVEALKREIRIIQKYLPTISRATTNENSIPRLKAVLEKRKNGDAG